MPIRDWKAALNRFNIEIEDRVSQQLALNQYVQKFGHSSYECNVYVQIF